MDAASDYSAQGEPDKSSHLWKYTPWRKVHPTGKIDEIPEFGEPALKLTTIDSEDTPEGVRLSRGEGFTTINQQDDLLTSNFLIAASSGTSYTLEVDSGFTSENPVMLEIDVGNTPTVLHLHLELGSRSNIELVTKIVGSSDWFGLMRTGQIGSASIVNDVVINLVDSGTVLRSDSIIIGRDAQVRAGTISSGSERTKADLRFQMGERGGNLRVLGSVMSAEKMHLDHHIEIHHAAPETFSRLSWHSACGGESRTVGTGMLRVAEGSQGADAGQIFHNLLLSPKAEADSIPELEVMENEVVGCGHGTANGPIDEQQLFYLESRGYDSADAKRALIAAFLNSTLSEMGTEKLHHWLVDMLSQELEGLYEQT